MPGHDACFYGVTADTLMLIHQAQQSARDWWYVDHGYFGRGQYLRITRNAVQHDGRGDSDGRRWREHGVRIQPWRGGGRHILVCPQSHWWHHWYLGDTPEQWAARISARLRAHTDRPIVIRYKPRIAMSRISEAVREAARQLDEALTDCHAVVVHQSGVGVQAALAGVPVFATGAGAVSPMACADLSRIESPLRPDDRERWAGVLADNQFTRDEIISGAARRILGLG